MLDDNMNILYGLKTREIEELHGHSKAQYLTNVATSFLKL
jgi:hypothetical protein